MTRRGLEALAVYHSHPTAAPVPSRKDLERNYWPGVVNLIISLQAAEPEVRAWWLSDEGYREAEGERVPEGPEPAPLSDQAKGAGAE